jgi:hypothetical protein
VNIKHSPHVKVYDTLLGVMVSFNSTLQGMNTYSYTSLL